MFTFKGEGFISSKFYNSDSFKSESGDLIKYVNTSIATKYTNPHTEVSSWDNMRITLKGEIAEAFERETEQGGLVEIEGIIHERSFKDKKTGNVRYYTEVTATKFRPLRKAKAKPAEAQAVAKANPLAGLTKEQIAAIPGDVLTAMLANA